MIDQFTVFTRGGVILWQRQINPVTGEPVNNLIRDVLMEEKSSESGYLHQNYQVSWTFDNQLELIFVAVYLNLGNVLLYIEPLLEDLKKSFSTIFADIVRSGVVSQLKFSDFDRIYDKVVDRHEQNANNTRRVKSFHETKKGQTTLQMDHRTGKQREQALKDADKKRKQKEKAKAAATRQAQDDDEDEESEEGSDRDVSSPVESTNASTAPSSTASTTPSTTTSTHESPETTPRTEHTSSSTREPSFNKDKLAELLKKKKSGSMGLGKKKETAAPVVEEVKKKPTKVMAERNIRSKDLMKELDRSGTSNNPAAADEARLAQTRAIYGDAPKDSSYAEEEESESDDEEETKEAKPKSGFLSRIFQPISGIVGNRVMTRDDLESTLVAFKESLMEKNVAADIAEKLCESVSKSLEGQKQQTFTTIHQTVKKAIDDSLTRILTPSRPIDVLQGVLAARERGMPYVIVFCGVNGVGKSTSLAKVAAYFLSKEFTVGIGGCDTFRSGAIEQLRTHAQCLKVPLYEKGYDRDAASVAADAIAQAKRDKLDVILIDTTGRMQDNTPLMRALSKLINTNKPDLVLFVGEALVGNDAVDQIQKFNRCLEDLSEDKKPRLIDGIILTKFDTIDDKVGAAISMTYTTGKPIVFVGTGQTYRDLKKMNVRMLIRSLLK